MESSYVPSFHREHWPAPPFCDSRFRCLVCEGGMGCKGRGFARCQDVPCSNRSAHMLVWRDHTGYESAPMPAHSDSDSECDETAPPQYRLGDNASIHVCTLDRSVMLDMVALDGEPPLAQMSDDTQWCADCQDAIAASKAARARASKTARPLESQIRCEPCAPARKRNRIEPLAWCDGRYRCLQCDVSTSRLSTLKKRCSDVSHIPHSQSDTPLEQKECVHFVAENGAVRSELKAAAQQGCNMCNGRVGC